MVVGRWGSTRKIALLTCLSMTSCVTFVYYSTAPQFNVMQTVLTDIVDDSFFVKTPGCRISRLDPFDASILAFLRGADIDCTLGDRGGAPLVAVHGQKLTVLQSGFQYYNITLLDRRGAEPKFYCVWHEFARKKPSTKVDRSIDNSAVYGPISQPFTHSTPIKPGTEFLRALCFHNETPIYQDFFFVPSGNPASPKHSTSHASPKHGVSDMDVKPKHATTMPKHSVVLFSLDAVSRLNFLREMPLLQRFLTRQLHAIDFIGYHKVGDNTFPNLIPLLTGLSEAEIRPVCWPNKTAFFDSCPFVWKEYHTRGFITGFIEDEPTISGFNYLKKGFEHQPTDYYLRPLYLEADRALGHSAHVPSNTKLCMGKRLNVEFLLDLITQFLAHLTHDSKFGFFWETSLTHDYSYFPRLADKLYERFLRNLNDLGTFRDTFIIFLSDHGLRWGDIRNTYQGKIEERMPFLFMVTPTWFKNKFPLAYQNLKRNMNKLTTPYDVHQTLVDLLDLKQISDVSIKEREWALAANASLPRAYSLFTPVSASRSCASAHISADYCVCHDRIDNVPITDVQARRAAHAVVSHLNRMLSNLTLTNTCAELHLHRIRDAKVEHSSINGEEPLMFYSVLVETVPGNALFEATLKYRASATEFEVVGTISRTNLYKGQSECIDDYKLRLYCYCI